MGSVYLRWLAAIVAACIALAVGSVSPAFGAGAYTLDPLLSLTGNCAESELDPIPDPSCPSGPLPTSGPFDSPRSVAVDVYGDIYVADYGEEEGPDARIYIFNSSGKFVEEIPDELGAKSVAVDSDGNLYVYEFRPGISRRIVRLVPKEYKPELGKISYKESESVLIAESFNLGGVAGLAVNPANDHLYAYFSNFIEEFGSATEENKLLDSTIGLGTFENNTFGVSIAIDATRGRLYASDRQPNVVRVFELASPYALMQTIEGCTPFVEHFGDKPAVAVDEETGNYFVYDGEGTNAIYEFDENGKCLPATIKKGTSSVFGAQIAVDNGPLSPHRGYLFAPSVISKAGHLFAYGPAEEGPPVIEASSASEITQNDAALEAKINPEGLETEYVFEYTTQAGFEAEEFSGASVAGEGQISIGKVGVEVSAAATGLSPGTAYRFRVSATNAEGSEKKEGEFTTYLPPEPRDSSCVNDAMRVELSAFLPDCRAYELVTPPDTNARTPRGVKGTVGIFFTTREAAPTGNKISFMTEGGSLPGTEATGSLAGDPYLATRGPNGWSTASSGPNGREAVAGIPGSTSPDQEYSFWSTGSPEGSAAVEGEEASYVRYPDGHSELIGRGSINSEPQAHGKLISKDGGHIIFATSVALGHVPVQLEENAPPTGTAAVYDRTADEVTHVVSLLPGGVTPSAGENAFYQGASLDGKGVAFTIGNELYLRYNDEETYEIGEGATFAGVAEGGARIFYLKGGDLFAFDAQSKKTIRFTESGDVTPVNVSAEGTAAYFVSPSVLTGEEENPNGAKAQAGEENLYLSREGTFSFVGVVTKRDVEGEPGNEKIDGLGLWVEAAGLGSSTQAGRFGIDPSRTTPDGSVMLFESRAPLDGYDPEGHAEVYRYDSMSEELDCLSCNPTRVPASGDASLQSVAPVKDNPAPFNSFAYVDNLSVDGRSALFQSPEPLVLGDTDGLQDVYEWEAEGVGSCTRTEGCIYLISSGHSNRADYLYAVSNGGDDVFFRTSDLLLPVDAERTPSIYDARVEGGFPEAVSEPCQGEACRPTITPPPVLSQPESGEQGPEEKPPAIRCPKGKHKVKRNGSIVCVKKHHKHRRHRIGSKNKGAAK